MEIDYAWLSSCSVSRCHCCFRLCFNSLGRGLADQGADVHKGTSYGAGIQLDRLLCRRQRRYSWGSQDTSLVSGGATLFSDTVHPDGVIGGGQLGYNWQVNQWVLGLEADFQGSGQKGDGNYFDPGCCAIAVIRPAASVAYTDKLNWFGTVRGRIGYAMGATGNWLPYVTAGWAFGHGEISGTTTSGAVVTSFSGSQDYSGWTVGGGVEWAFQNNWSAKVEYLYVDFGNGPTVPASAALTVVSGKMTDNIARLGVNYKF